MDKYKVKPNTKVLLSRHDPEDLSYTDMTKKLARKHLAELNEELSELQKLFYVDGRFKMLIVLQATDTGGKDGTIRNVFNGVNPQGVKVASFKKPTPEEFSHDYLWRIHEEAPANGKIVVFNRSHYEDVLVPRVHGYAKPAVIQKRYRHLVEFERLLADEGTIILKFFLNISKDEQKERLQARLDDEQKHWKFSPADLEERKLWTRYQRAFEAMLSNTSETYAPWYVIPANRKWYRNIIISQIIIDRLKELKLQYPKVKWDAGKIKII